MFQQAQNGTVVAVLIVSGFVLPWALGTNGNQSVQQISALNPPTLVGWGGMRLVEIVTWNRTNPASTVFAGEQASNQEVQVRRIADRGYNVFRVSFAPACSTLGYFMSPYNATRLDRSITLAAYFSFWIIIDYHGYNDTVTSQSTTCWLSFWTNVIQQFQNRYERIIWEPLNEPTGFGGTNVAGLSSMYQTWINLARSLGDTHWIVVENLCSYGCSFSLQRYAEGYPIVTDPLGRVFISLHSYMYYPQYSSAWNTTTAEAVARGYYWAVTNGTSLTGWPALNTEGGTTCQCEGLAPDQVLTGSAGYTVTTFHFIQTLVNLYDSHQPMRINWVWWPTGSWTDTPGAEVYGALADNGWGTLLHHRRVIASVVPTDSTITIG